MYSADMNSVVAPPLPRAPRDKGVLRYHPLVATASSSIPSPPVAHHVPVRLVVDMRVLEGRQLMAADSRDFGPVSPDLLNEVRAKWPD
jgi:hypothetical protein